MRMISKRGASVAVLLAIAGTRCFMRNENRSSPPQSPLFTGLSRCGNGWKLETGDCWSESNRLRQRENGGKAQGATKLMRGWPRYFLTGNDARSDGLAKPKSASTFRRGHRARQGSDFSDVTNVTGPKFEVETSVSVAVCKARGSRGCSSMGKRGTAGQLFAKKAACGTEMIDTAYGQGPGAVVWARRSKDRGTGPGRGFGRPDDNGRPATWSHDGCIIACIKGKVWCAATNDKNKPGSSFPRTKRSRLCETCRCRSLRRSRL